MAIKKPAAGGSIFRLGQSKKPALGGKEEAKAELTGCEIFHNRIATITCPWKPVKWCIIT
jgi:hypothetical protein